MFYVEGLGQSVQKKKRYHRAALLSQICHPFVQHWHAGWFHIRKMDAHSGPRPRKRHSPDGGDGRPTSNNPKPQFRAFGKRSGGLDEAAEHADIPKMCGQLDLRLQIDDLNRSGKRVTRRAVVFVVNGRITPCLLVILLHWVSCRNKKHGRMSENDTQR